MDPFEELAQKKGQNNPTSYQKWKQSLDFARASLSITILSDQQLIKFAQASAQVEDFNLLAKYIYQSSKTQPDPAKGCLAFLDAVDNSNFSLHQWIEALTFFDHWLKQEKKSANFLTMIGYLNCCGQAPEAIHVKKSLKDHLDEMLIIHGFSGAT